MNTTDLKFTLSSTDMAEGVTLGGAQYNRRAGGANMSPQLSWSGFPAETQSFALTVFDPDELGRALRGHTLETAMLQATAVHGGASLDR